MIKSAVIASRQNALVRQARAVRDGKVKDLIFVEGVRLCEEAARAALDFEAVLFTEAFAKEERSAALLDLLKQFAVPFHIVRTEVLESISDTKTPQGIVALARRPEPSGTALARSNTLPPLVVILHRLSNPANAGAMLRAAEAAGATGAMTTVGTTDIFSPKALRGAMGSTFRLPLWPGVDFAEAINWCAARRIKTVSTNVRGARLHTDVDWTVPRAIIVGAEASGLTEEEIAAADENIRVPMRAPVESLNAAVALGVILYEAARQRGWAL